jgi:hypothetical protein
LRVVRWTRQPPSTRSSSASRSLSTDLANPILRDAALIEPVSAIATNAAMPSNFMSFGLSEN